MMKLLPVHLVFLDHVSFFGHVLRIDNSGCTMSTKAVYFIIVGLLGFVSQAALADPAYKASDIVRYFATTPGLGDPRGLCIGTENECSTAAAKVETPAGQEQAGSSPPAASPAPFDLVVTFDYNSDALTNAAKENLDEFSKALRDSRLASSSFMIDGHTDAHGSETYNLRLSQRRARAVVRYLEEKGAASKNLQPRGFGKTKPRVPDPYDAANRRVETRLQMP
ncbi:OmpA family protein [Microvirga sp. 0TCS3.31]